MTIDSIPKVLNKIINEETDRLMPDAIKELKDRVKTRLAMQLLEEIFETKFYQVSHTDLLNFDIYHGVDIEAKSLNDSKAISWESGTILLDDSSFEYMFIGQ